MKWVRYRGLDFRVVYTSEEPEDEREAYYGCGKELVGIYLGGVDVTCRLSDRLFNVLWGERE